MSAPHADVHARLHTWLERQSPTTVESLGRSLLRRTQQHGLALALPEGDVPIGTTLSPELIDRGVSAARGRDAALVLSAAIKTARSVLEPGVDSGLAKTLFGHFNSFEAEALNRWRDAEDMAIGRVDWFVDAAGNHRALELNATIPAMEAYSDAAARAWLEVLGEHAGLPPAHVGDLAERNGSNTEELRRSIVAHASAQGQSHSPASIAILHREGDPQRRELEAIARRFERAGHDVLLATPDRVTLSAQGDALVDGRSFDILYRHIFARRLDPDGALARVATQPRRHHLLNPVNGHLEVKGLLAVLSQAVDECGESLRKIGLSAQEEGAMRAVLPWTRLLSSEVCCDPDGKPVPVSDTTRREPERFVLKRSWDYGGRSVLIGRDVVALEGRDGWLRRVDAALADGPGAWIVQELVASPKRRHLVVAADRQRWEDVYADASTFTATGVDSVPAGGVVRFATSRIVNIVGGGGVAPLIHTDVAAEIASALGA